MHHDKNQFWGTLLGALTSALLVGAIFISVFALVIGLICQLA